MDHAFTREQREIFPYHNGVKPVFGDPLEIEARYLKAMAGEDLEKLDADLTSEDVQAVLRASDRIQPAVRAAFNLAAFDEDTGDGLTRAEVMALWNRFLAWKSEKKASTGDGPNTSPDLDESPASP